MSEMAHALLAFIEPLGDKNHVGVHKYRKAIDWALKIWYLADEMCPEAKKSFWLWIISTCINGCSCIKQFRLL